MKIKELINKLNLFYSKDLCYDFDNSGMNIFTKDLDIRNILLTVDIIDKCIDFSILNSCNLIISHHPIIFHSFKNIGENIFDNKIKKLISYDISAYSIHTNFDVEANNGMGKIVLDQFNIANNIYSIKYIEDIEINNTTHGLGKIIDLKNNMSINSFISLLIKNFDINQQKISYYSSHDLNDNFIKRVAILPGSGREYTKKIIKEKCDLYISSDLSHHDILDLYENDITYINATHYGLEKLFCYYMDELLKKIIDENDKIKIFKFENKDF